MSSIPDTVKNMAVSIATVLLCVTAFYLTVFFVYANNPSEFGDLTFGYIAPAAIGAVLWPLLAVIALYVAMRYFRKEREFQSLLIFLAGFIAVAGLVFPTLQSTPGMVDVSDINLSWINLAISLSVAVALAVLWCRGLRTAAALGLSAMLLSALVTISQSFFAAHASTAEQGNSIFDVSSSRNVFVLSFDALQADLMAEALREEKWQYLKDFTFYKNAISAAPATTASIASELSGNYDYKAAAQTEAELIAYASSRSVANLLAKNGELRLYSTYNKFHAGGRTDWPELHSRGALARKGVYLINTATARIFGGGQLPLLGFYSLDSDSMAARIDSHKGARWDIPMVFSIAEFQTYAEHLRIATSKPMAHFLHFTFTHHPVDFDENCQYRSDDAEWHAKHQNRDGVAMESVCAARSFEKFLSKLDEIGAYDDALIILKSDHGQPTKLNTGFPAQKIRGAARWGVGRYMPVLMIKAPNARRPDMAIDTRYFILSDIAATLCIYAGGGDCAKYNGFDLLDPDARPEGDFYMNIVKGPKSNFRHDTHETIKVRRGELRTILAPYIELP